MASGDFATPDFMLLPVIGALIGIPLLLGGYFHANTLPDTAETRIEQRLSDLTASGYLSVDQAHGSLRAWRRSQFSQTMAHEDFRVAIPVKCRDVAFSLDAKQFGENAPAEARTYVAVRFPKDWQEKRTRSEVEAQLSECLASGLARLGQGPARTPEEIEKARIAQTWQ